MEGNKTCWFLLCTVSLIFIQRYAKWRIKIRQFGMVISSCMWARMVLDFPEVEWHIASSTQCQALKFMCAYFYLTQFSHLWLILRYTWYICLQELNQRLALKEELASKLMASMNHMSTIRTDYENNLKDLQQQISILQKEKDELTQVLQNVQNHNNASK